MSGYQEAITGTGWPPRQEGDSLGGASTRRGPVGFAVIGAGLVGPRHAEFATRAEGATLRVVCDVREDRGRPLAERFGAEWVPDYRQVVQRDDVDVVNICLPTSLHLEVATAAAQVGKHVMVEKPIELNVQRAKQLIDICLSWRGGCQGGVRADERRPTSGA